MTEKGKAKANKKVITLLVSFSCITHCNKNQMDNLRSGEAKHIKIDAVEYSLYMSIALWVGRERRCCC